MSRILIAWELGGGYGHLASLAPLARDLVGRGHEVHVALRDLAYAEQILGALGSPLLQAPVRMQVQLGRTHAATFPEMLTLVGYLDVPGLTGQVRAWRSLFDLVRPDLLVAEHAPSALLAARGTGLRCMAVGTGFSLPPATSPMPTLSLASPPPTPAQRALETQVLENVNAVLARVGAPALDTLGALYDTPDRLLGTFEELDPFARHRPGARYDGPRGLDASGVPPRWPAQGKRRLFGYLKPGMPGFEALMAFLSASPEAVLVHVPGMPEAFVKRFSSPTLILSREPVDLGAAAADCDAAVCLAGHGTTSQLLLAGCPVLLVPLQVEQRLTAEGVAAAGAGLAAGSGHGAPPYPGLVRRLLEDRSLRDAAQAFAARHRDFDEARAAAHAVARVEALAAA